MTITTCTLDDFNQIFGDIADFVPSVACLPGPTVPG